MVFMYFVTSVVLILGQMKEDKREDERERYYIREREREEGSVRKAGGSCYSRRL